MDMRRLARFGDLMRAFRASLWSFSCIAISVGEILGLSPFSPPKMANRALRQPHEDMKSS
jgi:hypothetical protein